MYKAILKIKPIVIIVAVLLVVCVHCKQEKFDDLSNQSNDIGQNDTYRTSGDIIGKNNEGQASNSVFSNPCMYWLKPQTSNKPNTF